MPIRRAAEQQTHQHKGDAERRQGKARVAPLLRGEVERGEGADHRKADALKRQREARLENGADHADQRRPLAAHHRHRTDGAVERQRHQRQRRGHRAQQRKAAVLMQQQTERRAGRQRAVDRHAVPRHHQPGSLRAHQPQPPRQVAGKQQAFAKAEQ